MLKRPVMAKAFDVIEESRGGPNGRTPFNEEIRVEKNVVYKVADGLELVMDLYFPSRPLPGKSPVVLDIPGGGWMIHNRERRDGYARLFAVMGATVAVIDHRLCPEVYFPENLYDVVDALNFLAGLEQTYNLDLKNVTLTGDSSGGHLSACVGCAASDSEYASSLGLDELKVKPANLICISGAFSFEVMYRIPLTHTLMVRYFSGQKSRKAFRNWKYYKQSIPYNYLNKDFPETFNSGGATDFLCAGEAKRMSRQLDAAGVKNEYLVGKNPFQSCHCYNLRLPFSPARHDMKVLLGWYCSRQAEKGVDMKEGYDRVVKFLDNYSSSLKGKTEC